ncbi:hypothetical protein C5Q49_002930 [Salmonella enterica subsp. enterica serovar Mississippi]|uniref:Uncharacterized protein n=7 Tax=Salmonella enterica TaxID=28901 RepID=A0A3T5EYK4_SALPT|nr:hypothetical protein SEEPA511_014025 [Salmonella enterica subsp. enterica serovar Paratyphi A str. ATCC 11511]ATF58896.1 hypothetical protein CO694_06070 [Salmonella enterica subsp. enterica serovar Paratyphi A]AXR37596.1 hypothetical protein CO195_05265 [Salmonella enterica subsp. enterica]EAB2639223.1 hypothetical protein [Salmonella enterica]EAB5622752.1 hypothetical protein [Salmonella enterica subsp. enterica serovar Mississippi]EBA0151123.1 hypothetical protein [Salmonella enterica su
MLSKNSHLRHNHFYLLIFIDFIFLMNFVLLSLSLFFSAQGDRLLSRNIFTGTILNRQNITSIQLLRHTKHS